jgi:L-lactate dehydrogenase complex protein LldG
MNSRDRIFNRLRKVRPVLGAIDDRDQYMPVVPYLGTGPQELLERFVQQAEQLSSVIYRPESHEAAIRLILEIIGEDRRILGWAFEHIPLPGLADALAEHDIRLAEGRDASVRVGLTGADAALAATGSLVLLTGEGKPRLASLLPPVHIAVMRQSLILSDMEAWVQYIRQIGLEAFRSTASATIISGPSRTADIAMQLILGMHGPCELHIVVVE